MNAHMPQEGPSYSPSRYQPAFWQAAYSAVIGLAVMVAMGAWALSLLRKAVRGEEVDFPL